MGEPRTGAEVVWKQPIDSGPAPEDGERFDSIVVGGGPGGSAAAGYLAMEGKRDLLIEKETLSLIHISEPTRPLYSA